MSTLSREADLTTLYAASLASSTFLDYPVCSEKINVYGIVMQSPATVIDRFLTPETITITMDSKYTYRPEHLSLDLYGEIYFWHILLKINNCFSKTDFKFDEVKILTADFVEVLRKFVKERSTEIAKETVLEDLTIKEVIL